MAIRSGLPRMYKKLTAISLSQNFRDAVQLQTVSMPTPGPGELLVRNNYAGVNASDINWTAGRYIPGVQPPFDTGFEGLGRVVKVGDDCGRFKPGDVVCYMSNGAFGEYTLLPGKVANLVPDLDPHYLTLLVSGLTASIGLERVGQLQSGDIVLVTAAGGGTGQFAVQLAKLAGCHVIGTCSTEEKVQFLRQLGCDRPINYKKENLKDILKSEYPKGVDVVYESVGGEMFNTCVKNLAVRGRVIIIGYISTYKDSNMSARPNIPLYPMLLSKSASIRGFFLNNYLSDIPRHFKKLSDLYSSGKIYLRVDHGEACSKGPFRGIEAIPDAIDYLYTGKSAGKVVVELEETPPLSKL